MRVDAWEQAIRTITDFWEVDPTWLSLHREGLRVVDVRSPSEAAAEALGTVPGGSFVPLDELAVRAASWDPTAPVVVVCRAGGRSGQAARLLEAMGFVRVASLAGGMLRWRREGRPVAPPPTTAASR